MNIIRNSRVQICIIKTMRLTSRCIGISISNSVCGWFSYGCPISTLFTTTNYYLTFHHRLGAIQAQVMTYYGFRSLQKLLQTLKSRIAPQPIFPSCFAHGALIIPKNPFFSVLVI